VEEGDFVPLGCSRETLLALASDLSRWGPAEAEPDWLVSGAWLCTPDAMFLATSFTNVLADGYVARTLNIHSPEELTAAFDEALPDIEKRLRARGSNCVLPTTHGDVRAPESLQRWDSRPYSTTVLVRVAERVLTTHRIPCGLLFAGEGQRLLVGTDISALAMVVSQDDQLIERYAEGCEEIAAADFSEFA
jgi:hypothetical protein